MIETIKSVMADGAAQPVDPIPSAPPSVEDTDSQLKDLAVVQFFSPVFRLDIETQTLVLQYRDATSGDVTRQYPSEKQLEAYRAGEPLFRRQPPPEPGEREAGSGDRPAPDRSAERREEAQAAERQAARAEAAAAAAARRERAETSAPARQLTSVSA